MGNVDFRYLFLRQSRPRMTPLRVAIAAIIVFFSFLAIQTNVNKPDVITWDVYGYYVPLPAAFIYHDLSHYGFAEDHLNKYKFSSALYQVETLANGNRIPIYTIGIAIMELPFFLAADLFTRVSGA